MSSFRWITPLCLCLAWSGSHVNAHEAQAHLEKAEATQTKPIPVDKNPEIAKAITASITKAQETFLAIWTEIEKERRLLLPTITGSLVKGWFFSEDDGSPGHYLWVTDFTYHPATKTFTGVIASNIGNPPPLTSENKVSHTKPATLPSKPNPPTQISSKKRVSFPLVHLADWIVIRNNVTEETAEGAYLTQFLRSRMDREARRAHDEQFPFNFPEFQPQPPSENANQL